MRASKSLRVAVIGGGFWARFHLAAWADLDRAHVVAVCDPDPSDWVVAFCSARGIPVRGDLGHAWELLGVDGFDAVDIVTPSDTHAAIAATAMAAGVDVICQKPLCDDLDDARQLTALAAEHGVRLLVHENWRWQRQIRAFRDALPDREAMFRGSMRYCHSFPVVGRQPALADAARFILMDMGPHLFDVARFLFGEFDSVYARTASVTPGLSGEDVATVVLSRPGLTVACELSYASFGSADRFPETSVIVEAVAKTVELSIGGAVKVYDGEGERVSLHPPVARSWALEPYTIVHDAMVACMTDLRDDLLGEGVAETRAADNLRSLEIVFAAYESALSGLPVRLSVVPA